MGCKPTVAIGLLGPVLDGGTGDSRWRRWRPSVALCRQPDLPLARFEFLYQRKFEDLARVVAADIRSAAPRLRLCETRIDLRDPWDFEEVYEVLHGFAVGYPFRPEEEDYLVHITTGSHVTQICLFLLTESRHLPARLVQTVPPPRRGADTAGSHVVIDLDLSRYDRIAARFRREQREGLSLLKSGIDTRNAAFNTLIERLERVALATRDPLLLTGPTGSGKTLLARRVYDLRRARGLVKGPLVEVNCATLRGDQAMSALFGHVRGAFTGAVRDRAGLLRQADGGLLFLDEIAELGLDEQAMLLRAVEDKVFLPLGADREVGSEFQLVAGTNRDLPARVAEGRFREDLLRRIDLWTFRLPGLRDRPEDLEPNLDWELARCAERSGVHVTMSREARERFLAFAAAPAAAWPGNFRELIGAVTRMATLAPGGRIGIGVVDDEIGRLDACWRAPRAAEPDLVERALGAERARDVDLFDRVQLAEVLRVCRGSRSMSEAGRALFAASRARRTTVNDADRLRKYLARFGLAWGDVRGDG